VPSPTNVADILDRGRERIASNPVAGAEIEELWWRATKRGPRPDPQKCAELAAYINRLLPTHLRQLPVYLNTKVALPADLVLSPAKRKRLRDAISVLHEGINERRPTLLDDVAAIADLDLAAACLDMLEGRLCGGPADQGHRAWHVVGYMICEQARLMRETLGVRARTVSRAGVAAQFTSLMLSRLGFGEVKAATIADHHAAVKARLKPPGSPEWLTLAEAKLNGRSATRRLTGH
jgi:hypothetical protein